MSGNDIQQKIQNMLDEIPDADHDEHRREYSMSKSSARWMANMMLMINEQSGCAIGMNPEQAAVLRKMTPETLQNLNDMEKLHRRFIALIGAIAIAVCLYAGKLVLGVLERWLDSAFWKNLLHWGSNSIK